ncbi:tyrosine-type recombinase/integrase [Anatilimnocola floriformis]|uniref:tyrosine-type recombinase/integrase n=1 Tax=Anatilimnocola floriformis TaxID=2948575 RepID=UPI0020C36E64|nr:site-specific integrase [Anatilimnocola floriformis]
MPRKQKLPAGMWKRGGVYYARFRKNGRYVRERLSRSFDVAKEALNALRARADRADFGIVDNDYKWDTLKKEFMRWAQQSIERPGELQRHLEQFEKYLKVNSIRQIDHEYVVGFREWRLVQPIYPAGLKVEKRENYKPKLPSPQTVNLEVATLRAMLNRGVEWKRIGHNPIAKIAPLAIDEPRKQRRALTVEEAGKLFSHAPAWFVPILRLFATTGMRHDEAVQLLFSDIDFESRALTVRANVAKNGKARDIPLDEQTYALLLELREAARDRRSIAGKTPPGRFSANHVFVTAYNTPRKNNLLRAFYAVCKRAGIDGAEPGGSVDIHSLRVTFTTLAMEHGASPKAVQSILGHSTLALTMKVYARATEKAKRDAISAIPFAAAKAPEHVLAMVQKEPETRTASKVAAQG